jgi:metallo-beta-lactamase family protein
MIKVKLRIPTKTEVRQNGDERSIIFSGDVGRWDKPILRDPTIFNGADCVLVESTYGDRLQEDLTDVVHC